MKCRAMLMDARAPLPTQQVDAMEEIEVAKAEADIQTDLQTSEVSTQVWTLATVEAGMQAHLEPLRSEFGSQTSEEAKRLTENASVEAKPQVLDSSVQSAPPPAADVVCQTEVVRHLDVSAQTCWQSADAATEAGCPLSATFEKSLQTSMVHVASTFTQVEAQPSTSSAAQTVPATLKTSSSQTEAISFCTPQCAENLDAGAKSHALQVEHSRLLQELAESTQKLSAAQQVVHTQAFGQLNVTVMCPKAECNIFGEHISVDGWHSDKVREAIEKEVIPRFTKVWVAEVSETAAQEVKDSIDDCMKEFADVFRERLSKMLAAPSVEAAAAAAAIQQGPPAAA
eukprot:6485097-Amphidinium_carterae.1